MSDIEAHRQSVRERIAAGRRRAGEGSREVSPCGRFQLCRVFYASRPDSDAGDLCLTTVTETASGAVIAVLYHEEDLAGHAWIERPDGAFLIGPAECLEGRTVVDLTRRQVASDTGATDPFIGTGYHVAPYGQRIAVVGCYWACPYEVVVSDLRELMQLPWPPLARFDLPLGADSYGSFGRWLDPDRFTLIAPDGTSTIYSLADGPGGGSVNARTTTDLVRLWDEIRVDLAQARAHLPPAPLDAGGALVRYEDWLSHNELQLALEELESVGDANAAPPGFWRCLATAARRMGLTRHHDRLKSRSNPEDTTAP